MAETQKLTIGTPVVVIDGRTAKIVAFMPYTSAVRVKFDDAKYQRRAKGRADVLYPNDFSVAEVR